MLLGELFSKFKANTYLLIDTERTREIRSRMRRARSKQPRQGGCEVQRRQRDAPIGVVFLAEQSVYSMQAGSSSSCAYFSGGTCPLHNSGIYKPIYLHIYAFVYLYAHALLLLTVKFMDYALSAVLLLLY